MKQAGCRSSSRAVKSRGGLNMNSTYLNPAAGACPLRLRPALCMAPMDALKELLLRPTYGAKDPASFSFYFTLAAVRFHQSRGCLQFAGAGHPPAIVIRRGQSPSLLESTC